MRQAYQRFYSRYVDLSSWINRRFIYYTVEYTCNTKTEAK